MASSADETAAPDPEAHCHDRTDATDYREPRDDEREELDPCRFCFPEGIDVRESEIIVAQSRKKDARLHRVDGSDGTPWSPPTDQNCSLTRTMQREDVTTWDELADALEEGGA